MPISLPTSDRNLSLPKMNSGTHEDGISNIITKPYSLNIKKSLNKKLKSTKIEEITYRFTKGGFTAILDAVTFELFCNACDIFYEENYSQHRECSKDLSKDRKGNITQKTYKIKDSEHEAYTINLYLPKCSLLVNGKGQTKFLTKDIDYIHEIIAKTEINGVRVNIKETNRILAEKLQAVMATLDSTNANSNDDDDAKCIKCNRPCRTRGVRCKHDHWVHYYCDKLSQSDIDKLQKHDEDIDNECSTCNNSAYPMITSTSEANNMIVGHKRLEISGTQHQTLAAIMLEEETCNTSVCPACQDALTNDQNVCDKCYQQFHIKCMDSKQNLCHACKGSNHQLQSVSGAEEEIHIVHEPTVSTKPQVTHLNKDTAIHLDNKDSSGNNEQSIKMKDLRQLELRLKKKEEQLKIKEALLNDDLKEKEKILERLYKAENRNIELESTIKTLNRRITLIEEQKQDGYENRQKSCQQNPSTQPQNTTDELIIGVRDKVTRFVLSKIDMELDKMMNQSAKEDMVTESHTSTNFSNHISNEQQASHTDIDESPNKMEEYVQSEPRRKSKTSYVAPDTQPTNEASGTGKNEHISHHKTNRTGTDQHLLPTCSYVTGYPLFLPPTSNGTSNHFLANNRLPTLRM